MPYTKTQWVNGSAPARNATNLNKQEQGIYDSQLYGSDAGGDDTYVLNLSTTLVAGMTVRLKVAIGNTGACSLSIDNGANSYAIKKLTDSGLTDLATGDIPAGATFAVIFDGTYFIAIGLGLGSHLADIVTSENTVHGIRQGSGNGLDADTLDGKHSSEFENIKAGDFLVHSNSPQVDKVSNVYVKAKESRVIISGTLRISFDLFVSSSSATVYGQIYKNGVAVGTERSHSGTTAATTYTEDISDWKADDLLQLYIKSSIGTARCSNLKIFIGYCQAIS